MTFSITRTKFSVRQAGRAVCVDVPALSPQARSDTISYSSAAALVVQNTTKYLTFPIASSSSNGNTGSGIVVTGAMINFQTAPVVSGGTATIQIDSVTTGAGATTNIVAATTLLGLTAQTPVQLTLATTNPAATVPTSLLLVTIVTSNNTVGTADVGFGLTIAYENVEDAIVQDTVVANFGA